MRTTIRSTTVALVAAFMAASLLAPLGSAQTLTIEGPGSVKGIEPGLGGTPFEVEFIYNFQNEGTSIGQAEQSFVQVTISDKSCSNNQFIITGPGAVIIDLAQSPETRSTKTIEYAIEATRDAPGLTPTGCSITGSAEAVNTAAANTATTPYTYDFTAVADYYGAMTVSLATPIQTAAPYKDVPFSLTLTNFGNANTRVVFVIVDKDLDRPSGERWSEILPTDVVVGSAAKGAENTATATFQVSTPYKTGWNNVVGNYKLTMTTQALDDPSSMGNTMTANLIVRVRGVYVPGFEALAMVGSLLGAIAIVRRRNQ